MWRTVPTGTQIKFLDLIINPVKDIKFQETVGFSD